MQSNQRVLLAVLLSFLVLWGYTLLVPPPKKPASATDVATAGKPAAADIASAGSSANRAWPGAGGTFERRHAGAHGSLGDGHRLGHRGTRRRRRDEACARGIQQPRRCPQELDAQEVHRPDRPVRRSRPGIAAARRVASVLGAPGRSRAHSSREHGALPGEHARTRGRDRRSGDAHVQLRRRVRLPREEDVHDCARVVRHHVLDGRRRRQEHAQPGRRVGTRPGRQHVPGEPELALRDVQPALAGHRLRRGIGEAAAVAQGAAGAHLAGRLPVCRDRRSLFHRELRAAGCRATHVSADARARCRRSAVSPRPNAS